MNDEFTWDKSISDVNDGVLRGVEAKPHKSYYFALAFAAMLALTGGLAWALQITLGMGQSGLNSPVLTMAILTPAEYKLVIKRVSPLSETISSTTQPLFPWFFV